MLLFALMSPVLLLGQWWSDRRHGRCRPRRLIAEHRRATAGGRGGSARRWLPRATRSVMPSSRTCPSWARSPGRDVRSGSAAPKTPTNSSRSARRTRRQGARQRTRPTSWRPCRRARARRGPGLTCHRRRGTPTIAPLRRAVSWPRLRRGTRPVVWSRFSGSATPPGMTGHGPVVCPTSPEPDGAVATVAETQRRAVASRGSSRLLVIVDERPARGEPAGRSLEPSSWSSTALALRRRARVATCSRRPIRGCTSSASTTARGLLPCRDVDRG